MRDRAEISMEMKPMWNRCTGFYRSLEVLSPSLVCQDPSHSQFHTPINLCRDRGIPTPMYPPRSEPLTNLRKFIWGEWGRVMYDLESTLVHWKRSVCVYVCVCLLVPGLKWGNKVHQQWVRNDLYLYSVGKWVMKLSGLHDHSFEQVCVGVGRVDGFKNPFHKHVHRCACMCNMIFHKS